jgi:hypothetical protein
MDLAGGSGRISGTVSDGIWLAQLDGDLPGFDGKNHIWPKQQARYTMSVLGGNAPTNVPSGNGFGLVTVSSAGSIHLSGTLADGTSISQSVPVSKDGFWPAYVSLYSGKGSVVGWITLSNALAEDLSGAINWIKPAQNPKTTKYYPAGFVFPTTATGSRYQAPGAKTNVLSLTTAQFITSDGNLPTSLTNQIAFGPNNRVTNVSGPKLTLTITPSTGYFNGSVIPTNAHAKSLTFKGVVLQDQQTALGYFLGTNQSGSVFLSSTNQ